VSLAKVSLSSEWKRQQKVCQECWKWADSHSESYFLLFPPPHETPSARKVYLREQLITRRERQMIWQSCREHGTNLRMTEAEELLSHIVMISQRPQKML